MGKPNQSTRQDNDIAEAKVQDNLSVQKRNLSKCLYHFLEKGFSYRQIIGLVDAILAFQTMTLSKGNQTEASNRLGISRGTFKKILLTLPKEATNGQ